MQSPLRSDIAAPPSRRGARAPWLGRVGLALVGLTAIVLLDACTEVVESLNPARLFQGETAGPPPPGADQPFPNLATVPDKPRPASTPAEVEAIREGLIADRERARHTDEELRSGASDEVDFADSTKASDASRRPLSAEAEAGAEAADIEAARAAQARAEALAAGTADAPAAQTAAAVAATVLRFAPNSTALTGEARQRLSELVARYGEVGGTLRVIGYAAPPAAGDGGRRTLAYDRALVVAAELERLGVPAERLRAIAGDDGVADAGDRVDVVIEP